MKILISFILITGIYLCAHSQENFYDYGWEKMMQEGEDYKTIVDAAKAAYSDTSKLTNEYNYKKFVRWNSFWSNRQYSTPEDISNGIYGSFKHHANAQSNRFGQEVCTNGNHPSSHWESWGFNTQPRDRNGFLNSAGGMGVMWTVKIDTASPNNQTIYAGSPIGGLWKTNDQGLNWFNISDVAKLPGMGISTIAISPKNRNHLLVGTGAYWSDNHEGIGIIQSFDGGQTWDTTGIRNKPATIPDTNTFARISKVFFHPTDSNKYYACANNKLYLTIDKGIHWDSVILTLPSNRALFTNLLFHPINPDTFYVSTRGDSIGTGVFQGSLLRTVDGGSSFQNITTNFNGINSSPQIMIDNSANYPNNIYVSSLTTAGRAKIYKSTDNGNTFSLLSTIIPGSGAKAPQSPNKSIFKISPKNDNIIYVGGIHLYRSLNGGSSFNGYTNIHDDMRGADFVDSLFVIAHDGGISVSKDNSLNWILRSDGLNVQQNFGHSINKDFDYLVTALQDIGFYRFNIDLKTWKAIAFGEGGVSIISEVDQTKGIGNSHCGLSKCNLGIVGYINSGNNFAAKAQLPSNLNQWYSPEKRPFIQDHNGVIHTAMEDVFKSTDFGDSAWTRVTFFDDTGFKGDTINDYIIALANTPADTNLMLAGFNLQSWDTDENKLPCNGAPSCYQKKLIISKDGGSTWVDYTRGDSNGVRLPILWSQLSAVIISPHDAGKIWVTFAGYQGLEKVYFSPDTGHSWFNHTYNLPNFPIHTIAYQENTNDNIYVGTDAGVYFKNANMTSWKCYNENLPPMYIYHLDVNECGGAITLSGHGRGIYKSPLAPDTITGTVVWEDDLKIGSDLVIDGNLTIKSTIQMAEGTKITVKPGALLWLDGGTLKGSDCSEKMWQGIELEGDDSKNQIYANQGFFSFSNDALISDAMVAVRTGTTDSACNYISGTSGGILQGTAITFQNNLVDIKMHPYQNFVPSTSPLQLVKEQSWCNDCKFISDVALPNSLITANHIELDGIDGLVLGGAIFENALAQTTVTDRGTAIEAHTSSFEVEKYGLITPKFENFYQAIYAFTQNPTYTVKIKEADFINNVRGVSLNGNDYAILTQNNFEVLDMGGEDPSGIYLNWCTGYEIEENTFENVNGVLADEAVGIVIMNSGNNENDIYRNGFDNLLVGTIVQGDNKMPNNLGFEILCSDYYNNGYHIALDTVDLGMFGGVLYPEIALQHGISSGKTIASGNRFFDLCSSTATTDIFVDSGGSAFNYHHHTNSETTPLCKSNLVTNASVGFSWSNRDTECPSNISAEGGGPFELGLSKKSNTLEQILQASANNKSSDSSNSSIINDYVRWQLLSDTIGLDSAILALASTGKNTDQMRMIAAMARRGDSSFTNKSMNKLLSPNARDYSLFISELSKGNGKRLSTAEQSAKDEFFIWAQSRSKYVRNKNIPSPIALPSAQSNTMEKEVLEKSFKLYPNPANNQLTVEFYTEGEKELQIMDMKGSLIKSLTLNAEQKRLEMDVSNLIEGSYLIKVLTNGKILNSKIFTVEH